MTGKITSWGIHGRKMKNATHVLEIRRRHEEGGETCRSLASEFGVTKGNIEKIVSNKTWKLLLEDD